MLITDHVLTFFPNPLIGENIDELGTRFPDMTRVYDESLCGIIEDTSKKLDIPLKSGVYAQLTGPSFETPAEIRMLGRMGITPSACQPPVRPWRRGTWASGSAASPACATRRRAYRPPPLSHKEVMEASDRRLRCLRGS
jgi:purine-nucleoside phosphorylase